MECKDVLNAFSTQFFNKNGFRKGLLVLDIPGDLARSVFSNGKYLCGPSTFQLLIVLAAANEEKCMIVSCADLKDSSISEDIGDWVDKIQSCTLNNSL